MPVYQCAVAAGLLTREQRERIAAEVTRIHCETTGAPPTFVHVFFREADAAALSGSQLVLLGSIRAGRTPEHKEQLRAELGRAVAAIAGLPGDRLRVATVDVPARWVMEGGAVLPEPGDEEAWLARHA